jgi:hypothetical protein
MSYLRLRWARYFTLAGWTWSLAPKGSGFDFHVVFPCDCPGPHELDVRIVEEPLDHPFVAAGSPHPAIFGDGPKHTVWSMTHGGAVEREYRGLDEWDSRAEDLWERAARE